jgi:hypothetical protein
MSRNIVLGFLALSALMGIAPSDVQAQTCRRPGEVRPDLPKCILTGLPEAFDDQKDAPVPGNPAPPVPILCADGCYPNPVKSAQGDDPDMGGREGVPPNSVGSGSR